MIKTYNDLSWDIDEVSVGSSTPDEFYEYSYRATAQCPHCGNRIYGTANLWSRFEDGFNSWLESIHYEPCGCQDDNEPFLRTTKTKKNVK